MEGRRAYFATARVDRIEADQARPEHFYAFVRDYLEFDRAVPFKEGIHYYESKLGNPDGTTNAGTAQNAVRRLPDHEYDHKPGSHRFSRRSVPLLIKMLGSVSPRKHWHSIGRSLSGSSLDLFAMLRSPQRSRQLIRIPARLPASRS